MDAKIKNKVIIVGAGMAGLTAAQSLIKSGYDVTILEKSRGIGGRISTRRTKKSTFDHGASFFQKGQNQLYNDMLQSWLKQQIIRQVRDENETEFYVAAKGLNWPLKKMAESFDIRFDQRVAEIKHEDNKWHVKCIHGEHYLADALILTSPLPQSLDFFSAGDNIINSENLQKISSVNYEKCITVLAHFEDENSIPSHGILELSGEPLRRIIDNRKKGISSVSSVTIQAGKRFSREYWQMDNDAIARVILQMALDWVNARYHDYQVHKWRYAYPEKSLPDTHIYQDIPLPFAFAGDAFIKPDIEGAMLSGYHAAQAIYS